MPRIKKQKRWMPLIIKIVLASKIALLGAFYVGAKNPGTVRRLEDSLFYRNIPVAADSFPDPAGVDITSRINKNGEKEAWIRHEESGREYELGVDMLPSNLRVIEKGLEERLNGKRASYPVQETCRRMDALGRRMEIEHRESLAHYKKCTQEIIDSNGYAPIERCEVLIAAARNAKRLIEGGIARRDSYILEFSNIRGTGRRISPGTYEMVLSELRDEKSRLAENIGLYDRYLEELLVIRERIHENPNL